MDNGTMQAAAEVAKEIAKEAYADVAHKGMSSAGELVGLIPRAINAALLSIHEWVERREFKLAETKRLLEIKLQNTKPEDIVPPEPHVAVPAIQAISYSLDNEVIRNMYANLLASSMVKSAKGNVHPAFVEFIKQLSPDDARILKYVFEQRRGIPMLTLRSENSGNEGVEIITGFTSLYRDVPNLEQRHPDKTAVAVDNLTRLELVTKAWDAYLTDGKVYESLYDDPALSKIKHDFKHAEGYAWKQKKGYFAITALGKTFCQICLP